jgi:hypothetical protein
LAAGEVKWKQVWVLASAGLMLLGAFGPWVKALGISVGGTDGSNDGWLVVAAALVGGLIFLAARTQKSAGIWPLLGGIAGVAVTVYDRNHINDVSNGNALASALVQIGWGLNLALIASVSFGIAGLAWLLQGRQADAQASRLTAPTSPPPTTVPADPPTAPDSSAAFEDPTRPSS